MTTIMVVGLKPTMMPIFVHINVCQMVSSNKKKCAKWHIKKRVRWGIYVRLELHREDSTPLTIVCGSTVYEMQLVQCNTTKIENIKLIFS